MKVPRQFTYMNDPGHTHTCFNTGSYEAVNHYTRKIWDGVEYIDYDSDEGVAVINKVLHG